MRNSSSPTLSLLTPNLSQVIKSAWPDYKTMKAWRLKVSWEEVVVDLIINKTDPQDAKFGGIHRSSANTAHIQVNHFGSRRLNNAYHRGGILGTIYHEWFHHLQWLGEQHSLAGWGWDGHEVQDALYDKWKGELAGYYAGTAPHEAAAEAYRVLMGYRSLEAWELNNKLLTDYRDFFNQNELTKHFMPQLTTAALAAERSSRND